MACQDGEPPDGQRARSTQEPVMGIRLRSNMRSRASASSSTPQHFCATPTSQISMTSEAHRDPPRVLGQVMEEVDDPLHMRERLEFQRGAHGLHQVASCFARQAVEYVLTTEDDHELQGLRTVSLLVLASFALAFVVIWLRAVLVPFVLAVFVAFVMQPVLLFFLNPARILAPYNDTARRIANLTELDRQYFLGQQDDGLDPPPCRRVYWRVRALLALAACIVILLTIFFACGWLMFQSLRDFRWEKYQESPRMKKLMEQVSEKIVHGPLVGALQMTLSMISTLFLMLLFLVFLLINDAGSDPARNFFGLGSRTRLLVQRYLRIKTMVSLCVALLVWLILLKLDVDLSVFFAFVTFLLNYIPHVGYTVAVLLPLPLVFLDPSKTWGDLVAVALWPLLIHQIIINYVEPRMLGKSLNLHPVAVIVSLACWTACWGAVGSVLSTPLTCVLRLVLLESSHPYATKLAALLEGRSDRTSREHAHHKPM